MPLSNFRFFDINSFKLLRLPFSLFLMPVYWFAFSQTNEVNWYKATLVFILLHCFIYPASNAYNSYMDQDEGPIGGLKHPPKATKKVYYLSVLLDVIGLILAWLVGFYFALGVFVYILASKAYSYKGIRLKKYPIISWLVAVFFQGAFTFYLVLSSIQNNPPELFSGYSLVLAGLACSALLGGMYPLTQIYQHEEDARHGDLTLSRKLGILPTMHFSAGMFLLATLLFYFYFRTTASISPFYLLQLFLIPAVVFFGWWYLKIRKDSQQANFTNTMRMIMLAAAGANLCFILLSLCY